MNKVPHRYEEECPLSRLKVHPRNPNQGDLGAILQSIQANGWYGAVIAQESTGYLLGGNWRYQAACHTDAASLPVFWLNVDDAQALRILLADNGTRDRASYDTVLLMELLEEVRAEDGLDGTGFDDDALAQMMEDAKHSFLEENDGRKDEKASPVEKVPPADQPSGDQPSKPSEQYQILVTCICEGDQLQLIEELENREYKCRKFQ